MLNQNDVLDKDQQRRLIEAELDELCLKEFVYKSLILALEAELGCLQDGLKTFQDAISINIQLLDEVNRSKYSKYKRELTERITKEAPAVHALLDKQVDKLSSTIVDKTYGSDWKPSINHTTKNLY